MRRLSSPSLLKIFLVALLVGLVPSGIRSQEKPDEKPSAEKAEKKSAEKKPEIHALVGGTVHPVSGPSIHRGIVLLEGSKVLAVGSEIEIPEGAKVHDVSGKHVSPGLVVLEGTLANARASGGSYRHSLDPYARDLEFALSSGITTIQVTAAPFFGFFGSSMSSPSGKNNAIIKTTVRDLEGMFVREPASIYLSFRKSMYSVYDLKKKFRDARAHRQAVAAAEAKKAKPPKMPRGLDLYVDILADELPTLCQVEDLETMRTLMEIAEENGIVFTFLGASEGWKIASELASRGVPVAVKARGPDFNFDLEGPLFSDGNMIPIRLPGAYAKDGVRVSLLPYRKGVSLDGLAGRDLTAYPLEGAFAVRGGMTESAALRALTIEPARILRIDDRVGSLEKGKDADVLIWDGHPLHYRSFVETAWINGKVYYEHSRSRLFRHLPLER